jgi:transforming growth factor-beta-induced protein
MSEGVITSALNFDANAQRGMIFDIAAKTYPDFSEEEVMMNIVETAQATDSLSTLVTAVIAADLVDTLSSEGPFTVFAPNNDAFAALAQGTVESLLMEENKAALADILTYHVVPGAYAAADVTDGLELTSVQGQKLMFTLVDGKVIINGNSEVILADVATSNGTVHVIDRVLMPSDEDVMMKNIVETAQATDSLSTLVTAVIAADLVDALSGEGPFTVFAPNNDAFAALAQGTVESLLMEENKAALADILTYHVVPGAFAAADVTDGLVLTTLNGQELSFTLVGGKVMINGNSEVILADVTTSNGTVHVINSVLMPSE